MKANPIWIKDEALAKKILVHYLVFSDLVKSYKEAWDIVEEVYDPTLPFNELLERVKKKVGA